MEPRRWAAVWALAAVACGGAIDNGIEGTPEVFCMEDRVMMSFRTEKAFTGRVFAKGRSRDSECSVSFVGSSEAAGRITVPLKSCGMERLRSLSPPGMSMLLTLVVSFHDLFLTKVDKAFKLNCNYRPSPRFVTQEMTVTGLEATVLGGSGDMTAECSYEIRLGSPDGPVARSAAIGEKVFHVWACDAMDEASAGLLVHECSAIEPGQSSEDPDTGTFSETPSAAVFVVDRRGCVPDSVLLGDVVYDPARLRAYAQAHVYKYADSDLISFKCRLTVCHRDSPCDVAIPPLCDRSRDTDDQRPGQGQGRTRQPDSGGGDDLGSTDPYGAGEGRTDRPKPFRGGRGGRGGRRGPRGSTSDYPDFKSTHVNSTNVQEGPTSQRTVRPSIDPLVPSSTPSEQQASSEEYPQDDGDYYETLSTEFTDSPSTVLPSSTNFPPQPIDPPTPAPFPTQAATPPLDIVPRDAAPLTDRDTLVPSALPSPNPEELRTTGFPGFGDPAPAGTFKPYPPYQAPDPDYDHLYPDDEAKTAENRLTGRNAFDLRARAAVQRDIRPRTFYRPPVQIQPRAGYADYAARLRRQVRPKAGGRSFDVESEQMVVFDAGLDSDAPVQVLSGSHQGLSRAEEQGLRAAFLRDLSAKQHRAFAQQALQQLRDQPPAEPSTTETVPLRMTTPAPVWVRGAGWAASEKVLLKPASVEVVEVSRSGRDGLGAGLREAGRGGAGERSYCVSGWLLSLMMGSSLFAVLLTSAVAVQSLAGLIGRLGRRRGGQEAEAQGPAGKWAEPWLLWQRFRSQRGAPLLHPTYAASYALPHIPYPHQYSNSS